MIRTRQRKKDTRFGTWYVRSLNRPGSLTIAKELVKYKLHLVGVQEIRWDEGGTVRAGVYNFFMEKEMNYQQLGTGVFVYHRILSAVQRVEFVSNRVSCIVLRGRWCNIIVLNCMHHLWRKVVIQKTGL